MVFRYAHGRYLMAKTTPSPDVEDDVPGIHSTDSSSS
jgi:hypothetical protein